MTFSIGRPHSRGAGYFENRVTRDSAPQKSDVLTCAHCQKVIRLHDWRDDGGWCRAEMKPLCGGKEGCAERALTHGCEPFMKKLEAFASAQLKLQAYLKRLGLEREPPRSIIT